LDASSLSLWQITIVASTSSTRPGIVCPATDDSFHRPVSPAWAQATSRARARATRSRASAGPSRALSSRHTVDADATGPNSSSWPRSTARSAIASPPSASITATSSAIRPGYGAWGGLLFDNPRIGLAPRLTWAFTFPYRDVERDYGHTPVTLDLEWIPLTAPSWQALAGLDARSTTFGEAGKANLYFFEHHRYDRIDLDVLEQHDEMVHAWVSVTGDIDRLGIESITADAWLRFDGITVALSDARTGEEAWPRLREFTDTAGLSPTPIEQHRNFRFTAIR
jgi:hypothetical protein